jgi:uncharacterized protein YdiU (UPF0061 family)
VLRSSIREFLCSEAMHHLGVPTTRALSAGRTGEAWCATCSTTAIPRRAGRIVCRVAPSFMRFGTSNCRLARRYGAAAQLVDFTIARDFPSFAGARANAVRRAGSARSASARRA